MAAFEQSRQSGKVAAGTAQPPPDSSPLGEACLFVRLWRTRELGGQHGAAWNTSDPAFCLVVDLISASQGVVSASSSQFVEARFSGIEPAILTARRLQWAIQGFSESDKTADIASAILVQDADDLRDQDLDSSASLYLEQAEPGQVLVSPKNQEFLENLPSLQLQAVPESALFQLLWHSSAIAPDPSSDEEALSTFIKENGLEVEVPPLPQEPPAVPVEPKTATKAPGAYAPVVIDQGPYQADPVAFQPMKSRLFMGVGAGVVVLLIIAVVIFLHGGSRHSQNPASTPAADQQGAGAGGDQNSDNSLKGGSTGRSGATSTAFGKLGAQTKDRRQKNVGTPQLEQSKVPPPVSQEVGGACNLEASDIPTLLAQAESSRGAGSYDDASRKYRRVLACDRGNAKALNGLNLIRMAKEH